jgi:hypothetical protein
VTKALRISLLFILTDQAMRSNIAITTTCSMTSQKSFEVGVMRRDARESAGIAREIAPWKQPVLRLLCGAREQAAPEAVTDKRTQQAVRARCVLLKRAWQANHDTVK